MNGHEIALLIGFFGTIVAGTMAGGYILVLRPQDGVPGEAGARNTESKSLREIMVQLFRSLGEAVPRPGTRTDPVRKSLIAAGYRWPAAVSIFQGVTLATAALLGVLCGWAAFLYNGDWLAMLLAAVCGGGFGYLLPKRVLEWQVRDRRVRLRQALPVALDLMVLGVEAGQAIDATLSDAARELRPIFPDLASELNSMVVDLRSGGTRSEVFRDFGKRAGEQELQKVATLLVDSDRFGTSLGPSLRTHARFLRIRRRQQAQESARKVSVKLVFPVFFLIFPCVLLVTLGPAVLQIMTSLKALTGE